MLWRCVICCVFITFSLKLLLSHINRLHSRSSDFRLLCGIDGCTEEYRVYNSFYHHVKRRHFQHLLEDTRPGDATRGDENRQEETQGPQQKDNIQPDQLPADSSSEDQNLHTPDSVEEQMGIDQDGAVTVHQDLTTHATAFVINARSKHRLSQKGMNDIVAGVQQYQSSLLDNLRTQMKEVLKKNSGSTTNQLGKDAMDIFDSFIDPFANVSTTFRQNSVIRKQFCCVDAEEIPIARTICRKKRGGSTDFVIKDKLFYYVPLVKSVEQFLLHPRILTMIEEVPQRCSEGFFHDLVDGSLLKSHPLFSEKPNALQIILYTDEIEICNPLGSFSSKNKLLMVYYTLGNINPNYRSKLAAIRLLAMAKSADLRQSGVDVILNRIKEDMDALYSGVKIQTINGEKTIHGAMVSLCGDTLAQHELAGFKEGVGFAYSKYRHCECSFEDMQSQFNEDAYIKRTLENHVRQCDEIEKANTDLLRNSLRTTYGNNRRSKLVDFPSFDIIRQTPQDIMHVILEGIASLEIKCVLNHLVQSGELNLDSVNSAILGFPYSPLDVRDRPSPISPSTLMSTDGKLRQSSGQMLVLLRILPFVLEHLNVNAYVQLIMDLIEIVQIVFAPVLTIATVSRLKLLIESHLKHWKELFPDHNVTPKQHYMIHLPSQIESLGPMVRHMCMRFESKHCLFKQWASKLNFKNVCKSLINQNQIYESCQNVDPSKHPIFSNEKEMGPVSEVRDLQYLHGKLRDFLGFSEINHAVSVKWLVINGNKYITEKSLILANVLNGNTPEFRLVKSIFLVDSKLYCLEYQPFQSICFDRNVMAYQVEVPHLAQATELVDAEKLVDLTSYYTISRKGQTYVQVKYYLGDVMELHNSSNDS
ncbi:uncharacterized protein LOC117550156 isoform X1 [Gymnodraco acuticeps]|uniref:Uncharacterized protein LOC117550156 isoform X1 n=1 Tax=Gymnodraco acuticeps TaxID=8218 RepID=A0A6P8V040_GYMAC|nr:uncharacterized protein LOC117550156 isoform X1 [Gymnodraco acuticeps]